MTESESNVVTIDGLIDAARLNAEHLPKLYTYWIEGAITIQELNMRVGEFLTLVNHVSFELELKQEIVRRQSK